MPHHICRYRGFCVTEEQQRLLVRPPGMPQEPEPIIQERGHESTLVFLGVVSFFPEERLYRDDQGLEAFLLSTALAHGMLSTKEGDHLVGIAKRRTNFHLE
jgi:hypothetical protein